MRDLFFVAFLAAIILIALRRPFLFVLAFCYVDIVSPQRLSFYVLGSIPLSLIMFGLAIVGWLVADAKKDVRFDHLQLVLAALFVYCFATTLNADFPAEALLKWSWVWKALVWSMFLPLALRTRLRIEALVLVMVLSAGTLAISGGLKTAVGGGGYGSLQLLISDNSGLFEGSIFSTVAIAIIPLILWLARSGTIFKPDRFVWIFAAALIFACLLIPVGTQARTGLVCAGLLVVLGLRDAKRRVVYLGTIVGLSILVLPVVPAAFWARMSTISNYQGDESSATRIAVWKWTWSYALDHPLGGGFDAYRSNQLRVDKVKVTISGNSETREIQPYTDHGRAYHNSYFEMLGEQGFVGLALWLYLQIACLVRMELVRRRYHTAAAGNEWIRPLATALQAGHIVYLVGALFVGIAFQPFIYMMIALQIALVTYTRRREQEARWMPIAGVPTAAANGAAVATGWGVQHPRSG